MFCKIKFGFVQQKYIFEFSTDASNWGCKKTGSPSNPIPPIRSGRINTYDSFGFKYGTVEIRAKGPTGDWIGAALWLLPIESIYGGWPASGEIVSQNFRIFLRFLKSDFSERTWWR